jgi:hypothetical protein
MVCTGCGHRIRIPVSCGNRFCPVCTTHRKVLIRRKLQAFCKSLHEHDGYSLKLLTLTIPNCTDPKAGVQQLLKAFRKLRQRKYFKSRIIGGASVVEITGVEGDWHPHLHVLLWSKYLPVKQISTAWNEVSPGRIVDIRRLPITAIISYVTKYVTKSSLTEELQIILSTALKGSRLFITFGNFTDLWSTIKPEPLCCSECGSSHWSYDGPGGLTDQLMRDIRYPSSGCYRRSRDALKNALR